MAFRQIKTPALANQAVINTKLDITAITGQVAVDALASTDVLMVAAASGLRKVTAADLIGSYSTDDLAEGSNLYFTDARAQAAVAADIASAVAAEATIRESADTALNTAITTEVSARQAADTSLQTALDAEITRATAAETAIDTAYKAADASLQTQIDNILNNVDPAALDSLSEIVEAFQTADDTLTAGITANATSISSETAARIAADNTLQSSVQAVDAELAIVESAVGLAADGTFIAHSGTNYIDSGTTVKGVDVLLDAQIKVVADALAAEIAATDGEVAALQAADTTLQTNIDTVASNLAAEVTRATTAEVANANAIQDEIAARILDVNTEETRATTAEGLIQAELDATQAGAGLSAAGAYVAPTTSNYHNAATSLANADFLIDAALKAEADRAVAAEGVLQGNIDAEATTREAADTALDGRVTVLEGEMDSAESRLTALESGSGSAGSLETTATTIVGAINELHQDALDLEARVATNEGDISSLQTSVAFIQENTDSAALDSLTEIVAAFQAADSSILGTVNANTTAISAEVTRATGAETLLQTNIDNEATARTNADTTLQNNIDAEATTRANADSAATTDRAAIRSEFAAADSSIQAELDATQTGAGLSAAGAYAADATTNYLTAATSLKDADKKLDAAIKANADALATEIAATDAEVTAIQGRLDAEEAATAAATTDRAAIRAEFAAADALQATGTANVQVELDATQVGAGLNADGSYSPNASSNYLTAASSLQDADNKLDAAVKVNADGLAAEITRATNREDAIELGYQTADSSLQTAIDNEATARTSADAVHTANIATNATNIATLNANLTTEIQARQSGDSALQTELDATQAGAGLGTDGAYVADATTNYITTATSLKNADFLLDAELKVQATRIDTILDGASESLDQFVEVVNAFQNADNNLNQAITDLASAASTARDTLQTNLEAADDALDVRLTAAELDIDQLDTLTGIDGGVALTTTAQTLIGAINEVNAATGGNINALAGEVDAIETALGLAGDGTFIAHSGSNYMDSATTAKGAREALDAALKTEADRAAAAEAQNAADIVSGDAAVTTAFQAADSSIRTDFAAADTAIQQELDTTQVGAGLAVDGTYAANAGANFIAAATSLKDADNKLDSALKAEETARIAADGVLQTNINTEAAARAAADGVLQTNIDAEAATRAAADTAHSNAITALETEMTATQTGAGLGTDGTYTANATANYISAATSLKDADNKLDAAIKVNADGLATEITARITAVTNEANRAIAEEARIEALVTAEVTRATTAEAANAALIQDNADNLAQEALDRAAADTTLQGNIDTLSATVNNIISNTDPAALDSLTEIVTAFQNADSTLTGAVAANSTAIADEETRALAAEAALGGRIDTEITDRTTADAAATSDRALIRSEFAAADTALQTNIDGKVSKAGDTMSGELAMGGNKVTGVATGTAGTDAVNVAQLNAAIAAQDISLNTTDDVAEGSTNLYYTDARVRAAVSAAGDLSYDSATGVFSVDTSKALLDLTDYIGTETNYANMANFVLSVNELGTGVELVDPSTLNFATIRRQTIDGDGTQTTFALDFSTTQSDAMVFVGGVIQDPVTHYTLDAANLEITFVEAVPLGTQVVIMAQAIAAVPYIETGAVTYDKLAADIKAYKQQLAVSAGTGGAVVDSFSGTSYRSAKYVIQVDNGAGEYETREAIVVHDGSAAYITEYAIVYTGASLLGDASVQMNGNNVELVYTANSGTATVKVISTYIDV